MDFTLEGGLVGVYFSLGKKCTIRLLVKESLWMDDLGKWTQVKWNQEKVTPKW